MPSIVKKSKFLKIQVNTSIRLRNHQVCRGGFISFRERIMVMDGWAKRQSLQVHGKS